MGLADGTGSLHGFPAVLTSFVGRAGEVEMVAGELDAYRLVTLTGPGGAGKTRLAGEVARQVACQFADGVWLAELATVRDPAQVAAAVAAALGIRELPSAGTADALAHALVRRQLLVVLDNCEHVIGAAAELCGRLLLGADDVRVLATSREPLRIAGEARCRLGPLTLPGPDGSGDGESEAVTLFAERARRVDRDFALDERTTSAVARLVARLDGMPLAIELAAARVDVLGVTQLLDRIDDRFGLLADGDRLADGRQRSLAATVEWSYQLLDDTERRVFRAVSVFPGPFTLDGAEAIAGAGAGRAVLRLADCSLLAPPRLDPDGQSRYAMLETLRAYGAALLAEAGEQPRAEAALAAYAVKLAEEADAGLQTRVRELASLRRFDAEDGTLRHALDWAIEHDPATALRLALDLAPWWQLRGRFANQAPLLAATAEYAAPGSDAWCAVHLSLGQAASESADPVRALDHFTAVRDALEGGGPASPLAAPVLLALCMSGRSSALLYLGRVPEASADGQRSLALARQIKHAGLEGMALACLSMATWHGGDRTQAIELARQAQRIPGEIPGALYRALSQIVTMVLTEAGDLAVAERVCAAGLASCREVGDVGNLGGQLWNMAVLDLKAGRVDDAAAHLHEQLQIAMRTGLATVFQSGLDCCGYLCAATFRPADAITVWAAMSALLGPWPLPAGPRSPGDRDELQRQARQSLGPDGTRAAEERGAAMGLATAAEYALMLTAPRQPGPEPGSEQGPEPGIEPGPGPGLGPEPGPEPSLDKLSPRERELVTLVARGRTDAQIAAQLYISVRTVSSHLDRIRDKTGCRRRADLTRLALSAGLV